VAPPSPAAVSPHRLRLDAASPEATAAIAARLERVVGIGDTVALRGELGAGKTAFARGFIAGRAARHGMPAPEVPSPTFTLVQTYDFPDGTVWHFDLYRLAAPEEALELGLEDALATGISLIEWPERLGPLLPARRFDASLIFAAHGAGRIVDIAGDARLARAFGA
jgi:tRNA threonylcarbamoyladenosine biosynthesis protein TsaE